MGGVCCAGREENSVPAGTKCATNAKALKAPEGGMTVATWNIAAINNNPFEYWITHDDPLYAKLMDGVEAFIDAPGDKDVEVSKVFTDKMFAELKTCMEAEKWEGLDVVEKFWKDDYSKRKIISGFMKDKDIGSKRLASMPDRLTNTITVVGKSSPLCRPTVVNNFVGDLKSIEVWWPQWKDFMFKTKFEMKAKDTVKTQRACELLSKISKSKYPTITEEEEEVSIPLQALCQAIFDAIMVHMMATLSPDGRWQQIKASIVEAIFSKKAANTIKILNGACAGVDVIFLQECAANFGTTLTKDIGDKYHILAPEDIDPKRDQNSMILLSKKQFLDKSYRELTADAMKVMGEGCPVDKGDLIVFAATTAAGTPYLFASFHGDTNGLATKPVVSAVAKLAEQQGAECRMIFGMDANTYLEPKKGVQDVADFLAHADSLGLKSCWAEDAKMADCCTCCNARTYVQPQLNKAVKSVEKLTKGDVNPKDHILVQKAVFQVTQCHKDNTGDRKYLEATPFPTMQFPSDHAVVSIVLAPVQAQTFPKPAVEEEKKEEKPAEEAATTPVPVKPAEEAAPAPVPEKPAEEAAPAPVPVKPAEEAAPAAEPEKPAEAAATPVPVKPAEEAAPAPEPEKPAEAAPAAEPEKPAEAAPAPVPEKPAEEAAPAPEPVKPAEEAAPAPEPEKPAEAAPAPEPEKPAEAAPAPVPEKPAEAAPAPEPEKKSPTTAAKAPKEEESNGSKKKKGKK